MPVLVAPLNTAENFAASPNGQIVYVAGNDGWLRAFDSATGTLLSAWDVGTDLSGITISRDGAYAIITEEVPVSTNYSDDWTTNETVAAVYRVNLQTGAVQTFQYTATGYHYTFGDVAFTSDGTVLLSQNILPGWSGWTNMMRLDLATGTFASSGSYYAGLGSVPSLTQAATSGNALVGQLGLSSAEYFLMNSSGVAVDNNGGSYSNGVYGYAAGVEAFSGTGTTGRVAIATGGGLHLYDGDFNYLTNLATLFPWLSATTGLAFNQDASVLYAIDPNYDRIIGISMVDYFQVANIPLGDHAYQISGMSDELVLTANELTFFVATSGGVLSAGNSVVGGRTDGDDTIIGTIENDRLSGGAGNDIIKGRGGNDLIEGGLGTNLLRGEAGNDTLVLSAGSVNDTVDGGDGTDVLRLFGSHALGDLVGIEAIELVAGSALTLTGNQFVQGLSATGSVAGNGTLVINMTAGTDFAPTQVTFMAGVALTINGSTGLDVVKGPLTVATTVFGNDGTDQIRTGNLADVVDGGAGNDKIMGLGGADQLTGGQGGDQFRYLFTTDSGLGANADRILDFTNGEDKLDFRVLDADPVTPGRQTLSFIGTAGFATNGTAQVRYADSGADTLVQIDLNGDGAADMEIVLAGHAGQALVGTDFLF